MIRKKIIFLNLLTLIPVVIFVFFLNVRNLNNAKLQNIEELKNLAKIIALENKRVVESVRQLLISFSVTPDLNKGNVACSKFLSDALEKYQRYGNFGVTDKHGNLVCSAVNLSEKVNLADRFFFKETFSKKDFVIGEYVISRATKRASINFGYPLKYEDGIVYATLDLNWLNDFIDNITKDENTVILILDKKGVILSRSPYSEESIGSEFPGNKITDNLTLESGTFETEGIDGILRVYAYEKIIGGQNDSLYVVVGKEKTDIFKNTNKEFFNQSAVTLLIIIFSLISGFFIGESLIQSAIDKLKEVENLRQDFISLVSHQLRTPATSIKWFTEILLTGKLGKINPKQKRILKDTRTSTKRMIELVGNVLSIAKLESGKLELNKTKLDLLKIILTIVKQVKLEYKSKNIKFKLVSKIKKIDIKVDEKLLFQALFNLIHNSFKYSKSGGKVEVNLEKQTKNILIKIKDSGIGIPEKEINTIFAKFSRASNAKLVDTEGAGLGLYLSKLIVNAHKGDIKLTSNKNGTLVLISIPLR